MAKLLHVQASPRGERSASIKVAEHFLKVYRAKHPADTVETLDLWKAQLPEFNGETIDAKYAILGGKPHTPAQAAAWKRVVVIADHFKLADKYLFSVPMWNFGIPYRLKQYIDVLVQPGLTFSFSPEKGFAGLVTGRPAVAIHARGGAYGKGTGMDTFDFQAPYLRTLLGFIGITDVKEIMVEGTVSGAEARAKSIAEAERRAEEIAAAL